jgi:ABC-2 type transport system ATP-binding protein
LKAHDAAEVEQHLAALRQAGIAPEDLEIGRADLEDVFVQIMSGAHPSPSTAPGQGVLA